MSTKGPECFAINCRNYKNADSKARGISFHLFPSETQKSELRRTWVVKCRRDTKPSKYSLVCSEHFDDHCFDRTGQTTRLRDGAVPTKFHLPAHLQPTSPPKRKTANSNRTFDEVIEEKVPTDVAIDIDHSYSSSPRKWKRKLQEAESQLEEARKKVRNCQRREGGAKKTCKMLVSDLYEKNMINLELRSKLDSYGDIPWEIFKKPTSQYSTQQRDFALTLHLQSPKAYDYLRQKCYVPLPHPRTLRRWLESVDAKPGLNITMLDVLKKKRDEAPQEYTKCCLMIDAMAIRRHIDFNWHSGTYTGYVDLGSGAEEDEAKEALVFMLVGLSGGWKAPIAYYLTKGLTAETQKELVLHAINRVQDLEFEIHALTMDGHATNVSMCLLLGANLGIVDNEYHTHISTDKQHKTFVVFDICHMMKLLRNTLQAYGGFVTSEGEVSWHYISALHNLQEEEGLRLANKLSTRHIHFHNQKMNVALASQLFSSSVAMALRTMKDLGDPCFEGCLPTAKFIEGDVDQRFCDWY